MFFFNWITNRVASLGVIRVLVLAWTLRTPQASPLLFHDLTKLSLYIFELSLKFGLILEGLFSHLLGSEPSRHDGFRVENWCFGTGRGWHGRAWRHGLAVLCCWNGVPETGMWHGHAAVVRGCRAASLVWHGWDFWVGCVWAVLRLLYLRMCLGDGSSTKRVA